MIRYKITIIYRDDKKENFDGFSFPVFLQNFIELPINENDYEYIPIEAVKRIQVKKYWKNDR